MPKVTTEHKEQVRQLYNYFSSKDELFEALAEQVIGENIRELAASDDRPGDMFVGLANRAVVESFAPLLAAAQADGTIDSDIDADALVASRPHRHRRVAARRRDQRENA